MAAIFLPLPNRFCMANCGLTNSTNSSNSVPFKSVSNFSGATVSIYFWWGGGAALTDHIVAVLVTNQQRNRTLPFLVQGHYRSDNLFPLIFGAELDTLLNDIASEFVPRKIDKLCGHEGNDLGSVVLPTMLDDMLRNIIPKLVYNQGRGASMQFL